MRKGTPHTIGFSLVVFMALAPAGRASAGDVHLAVEGGAAWQTRNDFRIPGDTGTLVKLAAPLRVETTFTPTAPVVFQDLVFPSGKPIDSTYVFNSYRLTAGQGRPRARSGRYPGVSAIRSTASSDTSSRSCPPDQSRTRSATRSSPSRRGRSRCRSISATSPA